MIAGANFYIVGRDPAGLPHPDKSKTPDGNINNIFLFSKFIMLRHKEFYKYLCIF